MNAAPQALQPIHAVFHQPGFEFAVCADFFLQGPECFDACAQISQTRRLFVDGLLACAAVFVQSGHLFLQIVQAGLGLRRLGFCRSQLFLKRLQAGFIGRGQGVAVGQQALAALIELA